MRWTRKLSIKTKLILLSAVSAVMALVLACAGLSWNEVRTLREMKRKEIETHARMLAFNSAAAISFGDSAAARQLLASLQSLPGVEYARLDDAQGAELAAYGDRNAELPPHRTLEIRQPVLDQGEQVGSLLLRTNLQDLEESLRNFAAIVLTVMCCSLTAAVGLAMRLQRRISQPILSLAQTAEQITREGNYAVRVTASTEDELGTLYDEFNRMLQRVDASERQLQAAHDELEQRVDERTAELRDEIGRRQRMQDDLVRAKEAAEAANVAKSRFLANMSHEIRTPLNAILGFADILRRDQTAMADPDRRDYIETIHGSGTHLLTLINDILDLSKIEADRLVLERLACSPHQILADVVSVLRVRALEKGLHLDYRWASHVPEAIQTDPGRLRQLLMNLVGNAIKFTKVGGVTIEAELRKPTADGELAVRVVDTGIGIPKNKLDAIFDPFVQADTSVTREFGGTGLGLTISRRIAEGLGGRLEVQSEPGRGSVFTVRIPTGPLEGVRVLPTPPAEAVKRPPTAVAAVSLPAAKVLLVEDGDTNRRLISLVLRRAGLEVATACNGQIGLDLALRHPFDLVLMDMQMPVMDGYTAATRLRQEGFDKPIIALTAHAMKGDAEKCLAAGCSGYLTKPIDADLLIRTMAELLPQCPKQSAPAREAPVAGTPLVSTLPLDDPDFLEIVQEFVERLHEQLAAMSAACQQKDMDELARLAHWLKGSGGTAGFMPLTDQARELETAAKGGDWQQAEQRLADVVALAGHIVLEPAAR